MYILQIYKLLYVKSSTNKNIDDKWIDLKPNNMFSLKLNKQENTIIDIFNKIYNKLLNYVETNSYFQNNSSLKDNQLLFLLKIHYCNIEGFEPTSSYNHRCVSRSYKIDCYSNFIHIYKSCKNLEQKTKVILSLVCFFYSICHNFDKNSTKFFDISLYQLLLGLLHSSTSDGFNQYHSKIVQLLEGDSDLWLKKDYTPECGYYFNPIIHQILMKIDIYYQYNNNNSSILSKLTKGNNKTQYKEIRNSIYSDHKNILTTINQLFNMAMKKHTKQHVNNALVEIPYDLLSCIDLWNENNFGIFVRIIDPQNDDDVYKLTNKLLDSRQEQLNVCRDIINILSTKQDLLCQNDLIKIHSYLTFINGGFFTFKHNYINNYNTYYIDKISAVIDQKNIVDSNFLNSKIDRLKQLENQTQQTIETICYINSANSLINEIFSSYEQPQFCTVNVDIKKKDLDSRDMLSVLDYCIPNYKTEKDYCIPNYKTENTSIGKNKDLKHKQNSTNSSSNQPASLPIWQELYIIDIYDLLSIFIIMLLVLCLFQKYRIKKATTDFKKKHRI